MAIVVRKSVLIIGLAMVLCCVGSMDAADIGAVSTSTSLDRGSIRQLASRISSEFHLDPRLVDAVIRFESDYNPRAVSRKGAQGLMQLMPDTARRLDVTNPFDPEQNLRGGVREFARLIDKYAGQIPLALAAYNAGETAVAKYGGIPPYKETRAYVRRIMSAYTGRSYRLPSIQPRVIPVRLVRDPASGEAVITNQGAGPSAGKRGIASAARPSSGSRKALGGGFGR